MVFYRLQYRSLSPPQIPTQNSATANKHKTNVVDDEGFIYLAKASKSIASSSKDTPYFNIENKFETLSNMPDDSADMINDTTTLSPEPNPQPIFKQMADNFSEMISSLENSLNSALKKKVNLGLIQIYPTDITQYQSIQNYLSDNKVEIFAVQSHKEIPKKVLLQGIPKIFSILKV